MLIILFQPKKYTKNRPPAVALRIKINSENRKKGGFFKKMLYLWFDNIKKFVLT